MSIEYNKSINMIEADFRSPYKGSHTEINQCLPEEDTDLCLGSRFARVTMKKLRIRIYMDFVKGPWNKPGWARAEAWRQLLQNLMPDDLQAMILGAEERGEIQGRRNAQREICIALGLGVF